MQIKLLNLEDWLIVTVSQLSWFQCITTDSPVRESASHGFIFSSDKSNSSRSCETGSQAGHWGLLSSCLFCTPSPSAETHSPGLPDSCSFPSTKVSALANGALRAKSFFWDRVWDSVMHTASGGLGAQLQARQGAAATAHTKPWASVGITDAVDIIEYDNVFVGIFYRSMLWRNYRIVLVAKQDITAGMWLAPIGR